MRLLDRYGETEVNGDAKWCRTCESYHFDFLVIPEFLDPDTRQPVESGVANMVMTGLYPFNQAIPKIRYFINDLVEVSDARCGLPEKSVRFLSRAADCVRVPAPRTDGERFQLFSADVAEILAPIPDVARKDKTGFIKFRVSTTQTGQARVDIELKFPPIQYPERVEEIRTLLTRRLKSKRCALGDLEVYFHRPDELNPITKV